nr:phage replisome organizer N-terminal domain-containing protein [Clostridium acetobutylicum]
MPEADALLVIWFKILCLSGKTNRSGLLMLSDKIYYTDEMLSSLFNSL